MVILLNYIFLFSHKNEPAFTDSRRLGRKIFKLGTFTVIIGELKIHKDNNLVTPSLQVYLLSADHFYVIVRPIDRIPLQQLYTLSKFKFRMGSVN